MKPGDFDNCGADVDDDDEDDDGAIEEEWRPLHVKTTWEEFRTLKKHFCAAILLPSGVASDDSKNVKISLDDNRRTFVVACSWPSVLQTGGLEELHSWKPEAEQDRNFVLRLVALDSAVESMKRILGGTIVSVFRLRLPFEVKPEYEKQWLSKSGGDRILFVDFCEEVPEYVDQTVEEQVVDSFAKLPDGPTKEDAAEKK
jgi:hypothetical protein